MLRIEQDNLRRHYLLDCLKLFGSSSDDAVFIVQTAWAKQRTRLKIQILMSQVDKLKHGKNFLLEEK